jgi:hypothetical protein
VSLAFKKSTHTDVGPNFPWDILFNDINELLAPKPDPVPPIPTNPNPIITGDDMSTKTILIDARNGAWYLCGADSKSWVQDGNMAEQLIYRVMEAQGMTPDYSRPPSPLPVGGLRLSTGVAIDGHRYSAVTNANPNFIASFGPIVGPVPGGVDIYGR